MAKIKINCAGDKCLCVICSENRHIPDKRGCGCMCNPWENGTSIVKNYRDGELG